MADLAYVHRHACGCVGMVRMIDDAVADEVKRHAEILAAYNAQADGWTRTTAEWARKMPWLCELHAKIASSSTVRSTDPPAAPLTDEEREPPYRAKEKM